MISQSFQNKKKTHYLRLFSMRNQLLRNFVWHIFVVSTLKQNKNLKNLIFFIKKNY